MKFIGPFSSRPLPYEGDVLDPASLWGNFCRAFVEYYEVWTLTLRMACKAQSSLDSITVFSPSSLSLERFLHVKEWDPFPDSSSVVVLTVISPIYHSLTLERLLALTASASLPGFSYS